MEEQRSRIAERIRQIRRDHALTQEQAAARAGVTVRAWQRWEYGEGEPYASNLDTLAREFGFSLAEFYEPSGSSSMEARLASMEAQLAELLDLVRPSGSDDFPGDPFADPGDEATAQDEPDTQNQPAAGRRRRSA